MALFEVAGDDGYELLVAENRFVNAIQLSVEASLRAKGLSQSDLARLLDVSEARVSQILSGNGKNLQARTVARIAHALGLKATIDFVEEGEDWSLSPATEPHFRGSFADWVRTACQAVEGDRSWSSVSIENDNLWTDLRRSPSAKVSEAA